MTFMGSGKEIRNEVELIKELMKEMKEDFEREKNELKKEKKKLAEYCEEGKRKENWEI